MQHIYIALDWWTESTQAASNTLYYVHYYHYLIAPMACMKVLVFVREEGKPDDVDFSLLREERR